MKRLLVPLAVILALAVSAPAQASHYLGVHWARTSNPFTLKLGDNVDSRWDAYVRTAKTDWSKSAVLDMVVRVGRTDPLACNPTPGRVEVCNASYGQTGWLGIASIYYDGQGHITQAVVELNDTYFDQPGYDRPTLRHLVACQEIGHTLGLDHQDTDFTNPPLGTCMDYSNYARPNQHPNAHDYDELEQVYAHLDGYTTVGQPVRSVGKVTFHFPA